MDSLNQKGGSLIGKIKMMRASSAVCGARLVSCRDVMGDVADNRDLEDSE
jgi:hypothetical protein